MRKHEIQGELTIYTAADEKKKLQALMDLGKDLEVNLSKVTEIDTAGLQILIALKQEAARNETQLHYAMHSQPVVDALEICNLTSAFGDQIILA
jgi:anti-sigma B factor antagonist